VIFVKVRARISKTNKFKEVTLRREPYCNATNTLYDKTPAYLHVGRTTVSGVAYEHRDYDRWVFIPTGVHKDLVY
jgi:Ribonuclease G/E